MPFEPANADEMTKLEECRSSAHYVEVISEYSDTVIVREAQNDEVVLLRFLRSNNGKVKKAIGGFKKAVEWRHEMQVDKAFDWKFENLEEIREHYPHGFHKYDKSGRPLYIERVGQIDCEKLLKASSVEELVRLHVQMNEYTGTVLFPRTSTKHETVINQVVTILDLKGFSLRQLSGSVYSFLRKISEIDQENYPERLGTMYIVNAPWAFTVVWSVVRPWLNQRTKNKIVVVKGNPRDKLLEAIDEDVLPDFLGGKDTTFLSSPEADESALVSQGRWLPDAIEHRCKLGIDVSELQERSNSADSDSTHPTNPVISKPEAVTVP